MRSVGGNPRPEKNEIGTSNRIRGNQRKSEEILDWRRLKKRESIPRVRLKANDGRFVATSTLFCERVDQMATKHKRCYVHKQNEQPSTASKLCCRQKFDCLCTRDSPVQFMVRGKPIPV